MNLTGLKYLFLLFCILLPGIFLINCKSERNFPEITLLLPKTRSPLFYNKDTMFIKAEVICRNLLKETKIEIRNQNDSLVHMKNSLENSFKTNLIDTFVFVVNDHSNFIMNISAVSVKNDKTELPVFIHVMP